VGWRQLTLLSMHACSCECALERLPIRTVRHTVASHDMQQIDLCACGPIKHNKAEFVWISLCLRVICGWGSAVSSAHENENPAYANFAQGM
jgi:hypothetical protein